MGDTCYGARLPRQIIPRKPKVLNPNLGLQIPRLATATGRCKDYRYDIGLVAPMHIVEVYSGSELYWELKLAASDTSH